MPIASGSTVSGAACLATIYETALRPAGIPLDTISAPLRCLFG